ncbi:LacI family DNA-binding transcriptional regulator [Microbacterium indicum]|uniref:LacI family DNA-binding transcriptional regulator n=1 Tax=Microbacterium indicum TaxID=358100 RepID=UPI00040CE63E|nr:LacI family DNA-binding transcriptional regulator [Microbacterium indicum]
MAGARATMRDVAQLAGVSTKTVSNVVTGAAAVRPETRARVEAAMAELEFVPNLSARELRNGRTGVIGVALPDLGTAYSAELLHHLVEAAHARGFSVQIEETAADPARERELVSRAQARRVDGLILNPIRLEDTVVTRTEHLPPVVLIGEVEQHAVDSVLVDNRTAAAAITSHLIERGARRIAIIGGRDDGTGLSTATSRIRLAGAGDALLAAGMALDPALEIAPDAWTMGGAAAAVEHLIASGTEFDAIAAFTDSMAIGALSALQAHGIRVPDDVLVTGFDDVEPASFASPPLTTVGFDLAELSHAAVGLLTDRIEGPDGDPRSVTVPFRVVERASTTRA